MLYQEFQRMGEYAAMGAFENTKKSLFCRKALGIRRYYENCKLYTYHGKPLYPSGVREKDMIVYPHYLNGLDIDWGKVTEEKKALIKKYADDFMKYSSKVPAEHTVAGDMWCHSMPNYGRIIREGLRSYKTRIENMKNQDLREGLLHIYEGIECYISRCVSYLREVNADPKLIATLTKVPLEKADNIYEAIVSWNFVMYLDNCDNLGALARELNDYFCGEDIVYLLENLYDNLDANDGYTMSIYGGCDGLVVQCLQAAKGKRRPMIELFADENTSDTVWNKAFELIRSCGGQPAFYNPQVLLGGLKKRWNVHNDDITHFCGGGCTESMIAGMSNVGSIDAGINLLLFFEKVMYTHLPQAQSFEAFYSAYIEEVRRVTKDVMHKISLSQKERAQYNPLPMRTFFVDDCITREQDFNSGGARYTSSVLNFAGMINVIDSMLTIRSLVFQEKTETADSLLEKLQKNDEDFLRYCRQSVSCFGKDEEESNLFANRLSHDIFSVPCSETPYLGGCFLPASIQFMSQVGAGANIGATPDGRCSGAPLCDSLAPIFGKDTNGPTAMLKSVTALDLKQALGVPVLNFNIDTLWNNDILKALILAYMDMGGIQMQITCVSVKMLQEAYENPELHRNLVVRVGGYSEYFYRLSDELKKMIIQRSIQKLS